MKGLVLASDEITNRVYIKEVKAGFTARKMCKNKADYDDHYKGAFLVFIRNEPVFTKEDALRLLAEARKQKDTTLVLVMARDRRISGDTAKKHADAYDLFNPEVDDPSTEVIGFITVEDIRNIAQARYPDLDFSEEAIPTNMVELCINAIRSFAIIQIKQHNKTFCVLV